MGFFSWKTQDTKRSIANRHASRKTITVYMKDDKGNVWEEKSYDGYGEFGGKDYFVLLAEMNGFATREEGLELRFHPERYGLKLNEVKFPNLSESPFWKWVHKRPQDCPDQGYFYEF